jgi:hypothetical protein
MAGDTMQMWVCFLSTVLLLFVSCQKEKDHFSFVYSLSYQLAL